MSVGGVVELFSTLTPDQRPQDTEQLSSERDQERESSLYWPLVE